MASTSAGSPKARNLGAELRSHRQAAKIAYRDMAVRLGLPPTRYQRWESGEVVPSPEEVAEFLNQANVNGPERDRMLDLARDVDGENWITSDLTGVRTELTTLIEFERTCTSIVDVSPLLVPGLLQTAGYVRAIMTGTEMDDVDKRVGMRLGRQDVIIRRRKNPLPYVAIVGEYALREPIGGPDVMAEQLHRLIELSHRSNIEVRVLPHGATAGHAAHAGPFVMFQFPKAAPIVHLEHFGSAAFVYAAKEVAAYERAGENLRDAALSESESRALIAEIATEMEKDETN